MDKNEILESRIDMVNKYLLSNDKDPIKPLDALLDVLLEYKEKNEISIETGIDQELFSIATAIVPLSAKNKFHIISEAWQMFLHRRDDKLYPGIIVIPDKINRLIAYIVKLFGIEGRYTLSSQFSYGLIELLAFDVRNNTFFIKDDNNNFNQIKKKLYKLCDLDNIIPIKHGDDHNIAIGDFSINMLSFKDEGGLDIEKWIKESSSVTQAQLVSDGYNKKGQLDNIERGLLDSILWTRKNDGVTIAVVPNGVLTNQRYMILRKVLREQFQILSIIELPKTGLFKNINLNLSLLIIRNNDSSPENVFLAKFEEVKDFEEELNIFKKQFKSYIGKVNL